MSNKFLLRQMQLFFCFIVPIEGPPRGSEFSVEAKKVTTFAEKPESNKQNILRLHLGQLVDKFFLDSRKH